jgi:hypothetical protein
MLRGVGASITAPGRRRSCGTGPHSPGAAIPSVSSGAGAVPRSTLADMDEERSLPPWSIVVGIVAALALIFLLGFGYGQQPRWGIVKWHVAEWHWGNILTVTVASVAIIASVWVSRVTLNRNAAQFEQTRLDSRNDELRAEVAALVSALGERRDRQAFFNKHINDAVDALPGGGDDPVTQSARMERFAHEANALFAEHISPVYETSMTHAFAIMMLTDETTLLEPIVSIQEALRSERANFYSTMALAARVARGEMITADDYQREAERREAAQEEFGAQIYSASSTLIVTAMKLLSPLAPTLAGFDLDAVLRSGES